METYLHKRFTNQLLIGNKQKSVDKTHNLVWLAVIRNILKPYPEEFFTKSNQSLKKYLLLINYENNINSSL